MSSEQHTINLLSKLIFINEQGIELTPTKEHIAKMLALCKKRSRPSYYKLRHASGLGEEYTFKGISMYTDDGKKMRRFESGLKMDYNNTMKKYLEATDIIDYHDEDIQALAKELSLDVGDDEAITKNCYEWVRDKIHHSGDYKDEITTCKASDVLKYGTGWCYAKSHLLAALLRANGIPTGLAYQRLSCSEYKPDIYCLHGLNWIYIKKYGWYRVDVRGNKEGVDAQFTPPHEQLAFSLSKNEYDVVGNFEVPLDVVVKALNTYKSYEQMICHFPDIVGVINRDI